jgi:hypothetical protein
MLKFSLKKVNNDYVIIIKSIETSGHGALVLDYLVKELQNCMDRLRILTAYIKSPSNNF